MISTISKLEHIINGKLYHLFCDCDSPLVDLKEALFQFQKFVGKVEDSAKAQAQESQEKKEDVVPKPDIKPVE